MDGGSERVTQDMPTPLSTPHMREGICSCFFLAPVKVVYILNIWKLLMHVRASKNVLLFNLLLYFTSVEITCNIGIWSLQSHVCLELSD